MPKQILKLEQFHGGLSTNSDPRDVADNELTAATDVMVDELGKIRTLGGTTPHKSNINGVTGWTGTLVPGYGLFQFSHDRTGAEDAGSGEAETGDNYLAIYDDNDQQVWVYSEAVDDAGGSGWDDDVATSALGVIDIGSSGSAKVNFYQVDGAIRVSDGNFGANNTNKWYGYIKRTHFSGTAPGGAADDYDGWFSKDQEIAAPTVGIYGAALEGDCTDGDGSSTATNLRSDESGSPFSSESSDLNTALDSGVYIAVGTVNNVARIISARADADDLTTVSLGGGSWDADEYEIHPSIGTGFNVNVSPNTGVTGTWIADNYEIATTFIYDGIQESLIYENLGPASGVAIAEGNGINVKIFCTSPFNPRITGGRVYIRSFDSGDQWSLLVDINLKEGVRDLIGNDYSSWVLETATGSGGAGTDIYLRSLSTTVYNKNPLTYEILNGWSQEENSLHAVYKTAVVANRITYVANIQVTNEDGETVIMGDSMIKSPINRFDTFPLSRRIEASVNDGDEIVKLEEYADRILQFKKNKMHLINISQELEFLEDTFMHKGVYHPAASCKTDFGIAWVNKLGCYLYDGQKVTNLLEKQGRQIIKESDWATFTSNEPMIGYIPKKRQLIVVDDNTSTGEGNIFLYDMVTQSWIEGYNLTFTSANLTNFVTDWNGDLVHAHTNGTMLKWDDASDTSTKINLMTKDIDFGQPSVRKKIYKVYLTYRGDATHVQVYYGVDGLTPASTFYTITSGTDGSTTGGSAAAKCIPYDAGTTDWLKAELKPSASINNISSFRLKIGADASNPVAADFEINDISIVYRLKNIK